MGLKLIKVLKRGHIDLICSFSHPVSFTDFSFIMVINAFFAAEDFLAAILPLSEKLKYE